MLTFSFTGVDGSMTESEILTSGMVGKEIRLTFDESWKNLTKTLVFRAGDTTRVVLNPGTTAVIPTEVLARPFAKLYVGVYGTDADGAIVIPTIMAEGPMIRYGADPIEDETAKELPVWENLQNQIGDLSDLETDAKDQLVSAINELHHREGALVADTQKLEQDLGAVKSFVGTGSELLTAAKETLVAAVNELDAAVVGLDAAVMELDEKHAALTGAVETLTDSQRHIGDPTLLETTHKETLVGAVNEVRNQVTGLQGNVGLSEEAAQLLVDILSRGTYSSDQTEQVEALADILGVTVSEDLGNLILYWDFRSGSLTDKIAGLEATAADNVTFDQDGAHFGANNCFIMVPAGPDGGSLAGHTAEIKFGTMELNTSATTMRLLSVCAGAQPATSGLQWTAKDCWSRTASVTTEFTDINMFSGKSLIVKCSDDGSQLDFYFEDQLIVSVTPGFEHTHLSIGSTVSAAFPLTVEYIRIYPTV